MDEAKLFTEHGVAVAVEQAVAGRSRLAAGQLRAVLTVMKSRRWMWNEAARAVFDELEWHVEDICKNVLKVPKEEA